MGCMAVSTVNSLGTATGSVCQAQLSLRAGHYIGLSLNTTVPATPVPYLFIDLSPPHPSSRACVCAAHLPTPRLSLTANSPRWSWSGATMGSSRSRARDGVSSTLGASMLATKCSTLSPPLVCHNSSKAKLAARRLPDAPLLSTLLIRGVLCERNVSHTSGFERPMPIFSSLSPTFNSRSFYKYIYLVYTCIYSYAIQPTHTIVSGCLVFVLRRQHLRASRR